MQTSTTLTLIGIAALVTTSPLYDISTYRGRNGHSTYWFKIKHDGKNHEKHNKYDLNEAEIMVNDKVYQYDESEENNSNDVNYYVGIIPQIIYKGRRPDPDFFDNTDPRNDRGDLEVITPRENKVPQSDDEKNNNNMPILKGEENIETNDKNNNHVGDLNDFFDDVKEKKEAHMNESEGGESYTSESEDKVNEKNKHTGKINDFSDDVKELNENTKEQSKGHMEEKNNYAGDLNDFFINVKEKIIDNLKESKDNEIIGFKNEKNHLGDINDYFDDKEEKENNVKESKDDENNFSKNDFLNDGEDATNKDIESTSLRNEDQNVSTDQ